MYAQLDLEVSCRRPKRKKRPCAPTPQTYAPPSSHACAPPNRCAGPPQGCTPSPHGCAPLVDVHPPPRRHARPTPADVRAPLPCRRACPTPQACAPCPQSCAPCLHQCARLCWWWQNKIYKEGFLTSPLHHAWLCVLGLFCGLLA
jgi:hypothetical protein